jgi:Holliday junction resolvasome RuvABC endonuclease subunit
MLSRPKFIAYEEVRRHLGTDAAHVYGGLLATLTAWCDEAKLPYIGVPVATIKRCATGKGNADKDAMLAAAQTRWPAADIRTHDEADAAWCAAYAAERWGANHAE